MKKILVPTDFSACANDAARVALHLAKPLGAWVYFLHISPEPSVKSLVHSAVELETHHREVSTAKSQLDEWVRTGESFGVTCFPILVFDNGTEKIENYVQPYSIDLIVMGSHGAKGIRKLVIGSNAQSVVKHASVPVLVVKQQADTLSLNTILFASTFNEKTTANFSWVANLVNGLKGQLHLLYLTNDTDPEPEQAAYDKMKKLASGYPGLPYAIDYAVTNDYEWAITNVAEKVNAGVIAVSENEKEGGLLSVNVALKLVNAEDKPVLVLKR
jgi:nucleotide-binding universal stress UspA family protein